MNDDDPRPRQAPSDAADAPGPAAAKAAASSAGSDRVLSAKPLPSIAGLRAALFTMAILSLGCGFPMAEFIPDMANWGGSTPAKELHDTAVTAILAFEIAPPVYLLAAIHAGRTKRGRAYLKLSAAAFGLQFCLYLIAQPFFGCIALLPTLAAGIIAAVQFSKPQVQDRLDRPSSRRLLPWPELIIVPAAAALVTVLILQVNRAYVPDEPNPPREFDTTEGWDRIDSAITDSLPAFEQVDGFAGLGTPEHLDPDTECYGGAAWDETWVEFRQSYRLAREASVLESPWVDYLDNLREQWTALGWEITREESRISATGDEEYFTLAAVRDDGVTVTYRVDNGGAELEAATGCIREP